MKNSIQKSPSFFMQRIASSIILGALFVLPFSMQKLNLMQPQQHAELLRPYSTIYSIIFGGNISCCSVLLQICFCALLLLPLTAFVTLVSLFLKKKHKKTVYLLQLLSVTVYLAAAVISLIEFADSARWFTELSPLVYMSFAAALISHIVLIAHGIIGIKMRNQNHSEYKQLCADETKKEKDRHDEEMKQIKRDKERAKGNKDKTRKIKLLKKKEVKSYRRWKSRTHIKTKIKIVILLTITGILATFIFTDLHKYRTLVIQTVNNTGGNLAEQTAAAYDLSDGQSGKISSFIDRLRKMNSTSPFPCERADIITTDSTESVFLEASDDFTAASRQTGAFSAAEAAEKLAASTQAKIHDFFDGQSEKINSLIGGLKKTNASPSSLEKTAGSTEPAVPGTAETSSAAAADSIESAAEAADASSDIAADSVKPAAPEAAGSSTVPDTSTLHTPSEAAGDSSGIETDSTESAPAEAADASSAAADIVEPAAPEAAGGSSAVTTALPDFNIFAYTTAEETAGMIPEEEKRITHEQAAEFLGRYRNEELRNEPIYNAQNETIKYTHPVTVTDAERRRLVGFSVITYRKEILARPYFQAKVFIFTISTVFFYISIVVTLFLADFIANPIIFLCGSVRKTANILSSLLSETGTARIDPESLTFDDKVGTNDEIKDLSIEINNIITLIRGILPYVSFHTLQKVGKNTEQTSSRTNPTRRELCFLFTDIRGFTTLCEGLPPKEVIPILNHYLDIETQIILNNGGDIDKYVGDEMMAFFSGPRKEINACKAAMEIRAAMRAEEEASLAEGKTPISMGIGINSGEVVFGPVGAETRKDFTSIGDTVNLAARLEGANKEYGSRTIISEAVYNKLHESFICRELDFITVKGKTEPVRIFEILQSAKLSNEKLLDIKELFESGLAAYRKKQWDKAENYFSECNQKYDDMPSQVFLRRIVHYKLSPPDRSWKGVFVMEVK